jgi:hypothetical protein
VTPVGRLNRSAIAWLLFAAATLAILGLVRNLDDVEGFLGALVWYVLPAVATAAAAYPVRDRRWGAGLGFALSLVSILLSLIAFVGLIYVPAAVLFAAALVRRSEIDIGTTRIGVTSDG